MARFQGIYLTSFFIGEGLSGLVPSIFALIQGVGGNPECRLVNVTQENGTEITQLQAVTPDPVFSIETFFLILFVTMLTSAVAYHLLTYHSIVKNALCTNPGQQQGQNSSEVLLSAIDPPMVFYQSTSPTNSLERMNKLGTGDEEETSMENGPDRKKISIINSNGKYGGGDVGVGFSKSQAPNNQASAGSEATKVPLFTHVSKPVFIYLLVIQAIICCFANGVFPSIQSYSCLPYGNVAYHWAVTLSTMANPAVCFMLFALPVPTKTSIASTGVCALAVAGYVFTTAVMSPTPPLVGRQSGEAILVNCDL